MDYCYWAQHVYPRADPSRWPSGKVSSHVSVERALAALPGGHPRGPRASRPPRGGGGGFFGAAAAPGVRSKVDALLAMTESDAWGTRVPYVASCSADLADTVPMWAAVLRAVDHGGPTVGHDAPVSTSTHEDEQLCYGRVGVPLCSDQQCAARLYDADRGPLHIYLSAAAQAAFEATGEIPGPADPSATCLLCIRRDVQGVRLSLSAALPNPRQQINRACLMPPPFVNLVDVPGGYKASAMAMDGATSHLFGSSTVVGACPLKLNYDPVKERFFFDQHDIKCSPSSFLAPRHSTPYATAANRLACYFGDHGDGAWFRGAFALYAARNGGGGATVSGLALSRAAGVHRIVVSGALSGGHPPGVVALAGFFMDAHVPAMRWRGTVRDLYAAGLAPEQASDRVVGCYPVSRHRHEAAKAWHSPASDPDIVAKLMKKGGPAPYSVRYVSGLLKRCAADPAAAPVVRCLVLSHFLGSYRHSTRCADPTVRLRMYEAATPDLVAEACAKSTTRELHGLITEFVAANTLANDALRQSLSHVDRASIADPTRALFPARTTRIHTQPIALSVFTTICKALNVHNNTLAVAVESLGAAPAGDIVDIAMRSRGFRASRATLNLVGLTEGEAADVVACFTDRRYGTLKMMRLKLRGLSPPGLQRLCLFLWAVRQKLAVSVGALPERVRVMQKRALDRSPCLPRECIVAVCYVCATIRTPVAGIRVPKTRVGISVDITTSRLTCNACGYGHVAAVDMVGRTLTVGGGAPRRAGRIVMCAGCGYLTAKTRTLGMYDLCEDCYGPARARVFSPPDCLCGRAAAPHAQWLMARAGADVVTWAPCAHHAHLAVDTLVNADDVIHVMEHGD